MKKTAVLMLFLFILILFVSCGHQTPEADSPTLGDTPSADAPATEIPDSEPDNEPEEEPEGGGELPDSLKKFENLIFKNEAFVYDGGDHSIFVENLPDFATVEYENNIKCEIGVYTVKATVSAEGYETVILSATLTVRAPEYVFGDIRLSGLSVTYDGEAHTVAVSGELPDGAEVKYTCTSHSGLQNTFTDVGVYTVKAEISCRFYKTLTLYAKVEIKPAPIVDTDKGAEQFDFDIDLKYADLLDALKEHNFTLYIENGTKQDYRNGKVESTTYSNMVVAVCDGIFYCKTDYVTESEYIYDTVEIARIVGDDAIVACINERDGSVNYSRIPAVSFYETLVGYYVAAPFAHLKEGADGGFEASTLKAYFTEYGECTVNADDDSFMLYVYNNIHHPEFINSETAKYTYCNVGNTKINVDAKLFSGVDTDDCDFRDFTQNGVEYSFYDGEWRANIDISYYDLVYVERGAHEIFAEIYGAAVSAIYFPYYVYNDDFTGYEYNVHFNSELMYADEYAYIGEIAVRYGTSRYDAIEYFTDNGGVFNYYGEW